MSSGVWGERSPINSCDFIILIKIYRRILCLNESRASRFYTQKGLKLLEIIFFISFREELFYVGIFFYVWRKILCTRIKVLWIDVIFMPAAWDGRLRDLNEGEADIETVKAGAGNLIEIFSNSNLLYAILKALLQHFYFLFPLFLLLLMLALVTMNSRARSVREDFSN